MWQGIAALVAKEFLALLKDPKSRFIVIGPPLIQFVVFGYAATYDLKHARYAVLDQSRTPLSRQLLPIACVTLPAAGWFFRHRTT